jgi:phage protein D
MSSANGVAEMIVIEKGYPESFAQRLIDIDGWKTKYKTNKYIYF